MLSPILFHYDMYLDCIKSRTKNELYLNRSAQFLFKHLPILIIAFMYILIATTLIFNKIL